MNEWDRLFFSSTRGRVVQLLRRQEASVSDLAGQLDLTDNGVRAHLATLERDGLVEIAGKRPGVRKPETLYRLTPGAERLFPKSYHVLANKILNMLEERLSSEDFQAFLESTGRAVSPSRKRASSQRPELRVRRAAEALNAIGGLAEVSRENGAFLIRGYACPLADVVREHPGACLIAQSMLEEITDMDVEEQCERNGAPRCSFMLREHD